MRSFLCLLAIFSFSVLGRTQRLPAPVASGGSEVHIQLGQSAAPLNGPWKFSVGDSPIDPRTGKPLWAEPGFDDSQWENVDLTPQNGAVQYISRQAGYVPGWSAKGHAGYWGYAWYRLRFHVEASPGQAQALAGPPDVDDIYQLFANGTQIDAFGDFTRATPIAYYNLPMMFELAASGRGQSGLHRRDSSLQGMDAAQRAGPGPWRRQNARRAAAGHNRGPVCGLPASLA